MNQVFKITLVAFAVPFFGLGVVGIHHLGAVEVVVPGKGLGMRPTYHSNSGRFVLHAAPNSPAWRLLKDGEEVWQRTPPFSMVYARVLDDGHVAGFGYTDDPERGGENALNEFGDLVITIIDPKGHTKVREAYSRSVRGSTHIVGGARPLPQGGPIVVDPENDRVIFLMGYYRGRHDKSDNVIAWRQFELSTGRPLGVFWPLGQMRNAEHLARFLGVRPLPGTPLLIAEWFYLEHEDAPAIGAHFALLDKKCSPVWQMTLSHDYEMSRDNLSEDPLVNWIIENSAILSAESPGRFDLYFAKEGQRVSFAAKQDEKGKWNVVETGRKKFTPPGLDASRTTRADDKVGSH